MKTTYIVNLLYLLIAVNTTYFLGKSLNRHGEHFLRAIFKDRMEIVLPVNKILLIGFYLVNIGLVLMFNSLQADIIPYPIEYLSIKIGITYVVIALMHYFNLFVFILIESRISKQTQTSKQ